MPPSPPPPSPLTIKPGISSRYDFKLNPSSIHKVAVLVIDVQDFCYVQDNSYYSQRYEEVVCNCSQLVSKARSLANCETAFTFLQAQFEDCRDVSVDYKLSGELLSQLPTPSKPATFPTSSQSSLTPEPGTDLLFPKTSCNVFQSTNIDFVLRSLNVKQLIICGQLTDQCVESAVRDAADLGYLVTVVKDGCIAKSDGEHQKGVHGMRGFSRLMMTKDVLEELSVFDNDDPDDPDDLIDYVVKSQKTQCGGDEAGSRPLCKEENQANSDKSMLYTYFDHIECPKVNETSAYTAILHILKAQGVKFLRIGAVDVSNELRCKSTIVKTVAPNKVSKVLTLAECCSCMPKYGDVILPGTNLSAKRVLPMYPDVSSLKILPYTKSSAFMFASLLDPSTGLPSPFCTRSILQKVISSANEKLGLGFNVGAELEFVLFDPVTGEAVDKTNFAYSKTLNEKDGFLNDLYEYLAAQEIEIETVHAESAWGQFEVVLKYQADPVRLADNITYTRETINACAHKWNLKALFLPKIRSDQAGSGLHVHLSLYKTLSSSSDECCNDNRNRTMVSEVWPLTKQVESASFLEGILCHLPSLLAVTMPSENSFLRVGEGCWTGHSYASWAVEDKESPLRICLTPGDPSSTNIELKLFDSAANPYLGLACTLACGIRGILESMELRPPSSYCSDDCKLPQSLSESLRLLEEDEFLTNLMGAQLTRGYIAVKSAESIFDKSRTLDEEVKYQLSK